MKYLLLIFMCISTSIFAADYNGANQRPDTKNTKPSSFVIYVDGVLQPGTYARHDLAKIAQIELSQRYPGRLVKLVTEEEVNTTWVVTSSAKSSSKSSSSSSKSSSSKSSSASSVKSSSASSAIATGLSLPVTIQGETYVTMKGIINEPTGDVGGGENAGSIDATDWLNYPPVQIPKEGVYKITYRLAALLTGSSFDLMDARTLTIHDSLTVPMTGNWQSWVTVEREVRLPAGTFTPRIYAKTSGFNINWIKIAAVTAQSSTSASSAITVTRVPTMEFNRPSARENGSALAPTEIKGYSVRKIAASGETITIELKPQETVAHSYKLPWSVADTDRVEIAAIDTNGLYSNYVTVPWSTATN